MTISSATDPTSDFLQGSIAGAPDRHLPALGNSMRSVLDQLGLSERHLHKVLPRPVFAPHDTITRAADATVRLIKLLDSLADRYFDGDMAAILHAQAMPPRMADIIARGSVKNRTIHGRADILIQDSQPYIIEINIGSGLGGMYLGQYYEAIMTQPDFSVFLDEHGLRHVNTTA